MYIRLLLTVLFFFTWHTPAIAGHEKGNGGYGVLCKEGEGYFSYLYDIIEAHHRYRLKMQDPRGPTDFLNPVELALRLAYRLNALDPARYVKYKTWILSFDDESRMVTGADMTEVGDIGLGFIPKNCELQQLIVQHTPISKEDRRYFINYDLWRQLKTFHRAATILHEVIYRDLLQTRHEVKNSEGVRYLNILILSSEINKKTPEEYESLLRSFGFE